MMSLRTATVGVPFADAETVRGLLVVYLTVGLPPADALMPGTADLRNVVWLRNVDCDSRRVVTI
jgi:hypothetical protein